MKIKNKNKNKNKIFIWLAILTILLGVGYFAYTKYNSNLNNDGENKTTDKEVKIPKKSPSDDKQGSNLKENPEKKTTESNTDKPLPPTTDDDGLKTLQVSASSDRNGDTVYLRGGVNYPAKGGKCSATLTGPSGQTIIKTTEVLENPASADCKTIAIQASDLAPGKWSFSLEYKSNEYKGVSNSASFTI